MIDGIARIGKTIDHAIDKFIGVILETRKGYNQTVFLYNASGDDSVPCKNDKLIILKVDGTGNFIGAGILTESKGAKPGEKIFFGRDADGKVTSKLSMLNNGDGIWEADGNITVKKKKNQDYETDGDYSVKSKGDQSFKSDKNTSIEASEKATVKGADVDVVGKVVIKGGPFDCKGTAAPSGTGCLCAMPFCMATGAPQTGEKASGT
jgi:hypothetical protein